MTPEDFNFMSVLIKDKSGLIVGKDKSYLLESRLMPVARNQGLKSLDELVLVIRTKSDKVLVNQVVEAMTTNESFFFRDVKPFDMFRDRILPDIIKKRATKKSFRIWCAAASSGQEPYSLAMIIKEAELQLKGWNVEVIGTDLSTEILDKARAGYYTQFEVQRGLPIQLLLKYFKKNGDGWEIAPEIKKMVTYKEYNLLGSLKPLGVFDVVYCRNVLIYFDQETKTKVLDQICDMMPSDGSLLLGGAETVLGITEKFKPVPGSRGIYCKTENNENYLGAVVS